MAAGGGSFVLVPGAWTGDWIWEDTAARLRIAGHEAVTLTLPGLAAGAEPAAAAAVTSDQHVAAVVELLGRVRAPRVVLVGHSYSGTVVGRVADRVPERVARVVQVAAFLPRDGRSMLDDWGGDAELRAEECRHIRENGMLWAPPAAAALAMEPGLTTPQRAWLAERFVAHPGRTVLDAAVLTRPVTAQPTTYVATAWDDEDPRADLPPELADGVPPGWRVETLVSGHWPMLSCPDALQHVLEEQVDP